MATKPKMIAVEKAVHDRLVDMFIFFVRENIKLQNENAALRAQINR